MNGTYLHNELVHLRAAARQNPSAHAYVKLAENQLCLGAMDKAELNADVALAMDPMSIPALEIRAKVRHIKCDYHGAVQDYRCLVTHGQDCEQAVQTCNKQIKACLKSHSPKEAKARMHSEALWERAQGLATLFLEHAQTQQIGGLPPPQHSTANSGPNSVPSTVDLSHTSFIAMVSSSSSLTPQGSHTDLSLASVDGSSHGSTAATSNHSNADDSLHVVTPIDQTQKSAEHITHDSQPGSSATECVHTSSAAVQSCISGSQLDTTLITTSTTPAAMSGELAPRGVDLFVGRAVGPPQHRTVAVGTDAVYNGNSFVGRAAGAPHTRTVAVGTDAVQLVDVSVGRAAGPPQTRTVAVGTNNGIDAAYFDNCQVQALIRQAIDETLTIFKTHADRAAARKRGVNASCDKSSAIETFHAWRGLTGYDKVRELKRTTAHTRLRPAFEGLLKHLELRSRTVSLQHQKHCCNRAFQAWRGAVACKRAKSAAVSGVHGMCTRRLLLKGFFALRGFMADMRAKSSAVAKTKSMCTQHTLMEAFLSLRRGVAYAQAKKAAQKQAQQSYQQHALLRALFALRTEVVHTQAKKAAVQQAQQLWQHNALCRASFALRNEVAYRRAKEAVVKQADRLCQRHALARAFLDLRIVSSELRAARRETAANRAARKARRKAVVNAGAANLEAEQQAATAAVIAQAQHVQHRAAKTADCKAVVEQGVVRAAAGAPKHKSALPSTELPQGSPRCALEPKAEQRREDVEGKSTAKQPLATMLVDQSKMEEGLRQTGKLQLKAEQGVQQQAKEMHEVVKVELGQEAVKVKQGQEVVKVQQGGKQAMAEEVHEIVKGEPGLEAGKAEEGQAEAKAQHCHASVKATCDCMPAQASTPATHAQPKVEDCSKLPSNKAQGRTPEDQDCSKQLSTNVQKAGCSQQLSSKANEPSALEKKQQAKLQAKASRLTSKASASSTLVVDGPLTNTFLADATNLAQRNNFCEAKGKGLLVDKSAQLAARRKIAEISASRASRRLPANNSQNNSTKHKARSARDAVQSTGVFEDTNQTDMRVNQAMHTARNARSVVQSTGSMEETNETYLTRPRNGHQYHHGQGNPQAHVTSNTTASNTLSPSTNGTRHTMLAAATAAGSHAQLPTGPSQEQRDCLAAGGVPPHAVDAVFAEQQSRMMQLQGEKSTKSAQAVGMPQGESERYLQGPDYWRLVHVDSLKARCSPEEAAVARAAGWDYFTLVPGCGNCGYTTDVVSTVVCIAAQPPVARAAFAEHVRQLDSRMRANSSLVWEATAYAASAGFGCDMLLDSIEAEVGQGVVPGLPSDELLKNCREPFYLHSMVLWFRVVAAHHLLTTEDGNFRLFAEYEWSQDRSSPAGTGNQPMEYSGRLPETCQRFVMPLATPSDNGTVFAQKSANNATIQSIANEIGISAAVARLADVQNMSASPATVTEIASVNVCPWSGRQKHFVFLPRREHYAVGWQM